ncbi:MAG: bile acid:sodium symporter [Syntrophobacter sp.]
MIRLKDFLTVLAAISSMIVGIMLPEVGEPFQPYPIHCMMGLLFFSFLQFRSGQMLIASQGSLASITFYVVVKLVLLPTIIFFCFEFIAPSYSRAALLLSGVSSGVAAPFFALLVGANMTIVFGMVIITSALVPFTLPAMVKVLLGKSMEIPFFSMFSLLFFVIFVPLAFSEILKRMYPVFSEKLSRLTFPVSLLSFVITNLGVFSKYSSFLKSEPSVIPASIGVSVALAGVYFISGIILGSGRPLSDRLALIISFGNMNNILVVVFSAQFFGSLEPTVAAMYTAAFFGLLLPQRLYQGWMHKRMS